MRGLSPHIRGNLTADGVKLAGLGSIPAHTGEPNLIEPLSPGRRVYPRTYGGTRFAHAILGVEWGLSPHIRGNRLTHTDRLCRRWSIPAHTGEPARPVNRAVPPRVYPRTYGGTLDYALNTTIQRGLSPHIRGNPVTAVLPLLTGGSIPAHTGEPSTLRLVPVLPRVYPRTYGGTNSLPRCADALGGLSPHIRGNLFQSTT